MLRLEPPGCRVGEAVSWGLRFLCGHAWVDLLLFKMFSNPRDQLVDYFFRHSGGAEREGRQLIFLSHCHVSDTCEAPCTRCLLSPLSTGGGGLTLLPHFTKEEAGTEVACPHHTLACLGLVSKSVVVPLPDLPKRDSVVVFNTTHKSLYLFSSRGQSVSGVDRS